MIKRIGIAAVITPLLAVVLSLGLLVTTTAPAQAFSPPPPIPIGTTIPAPAGLGAAAACVASVACATVVAGGALLIGGLYLTRDSWMPLLKGKLGAAFGGNTPFQNNQCIVSIAEAHPVERGIVVGGAISQTGCYFNNVARDLGLKQLGHLKCKPRNGNGPGVAVPPPAGAMGGALISTPNNSQWAIQAPDLCPIGFMVQAVKFQAYWSWWDGKYPGATWQIGEPVPGDELTTTSTVQCEMPNGTFKQLVAVGTGDEGVILPSCQADTPGAIPRSYDLTAGYPGIEEPVYHTEIQSPKEEYPDCFDAAGAFLNTCTVRVWLNGEPCVRGMAGCSYPQRWREDHPDAQFDCRWGPYVVAFKNCAKLEGRYQIDTKVDTITKVDPVTGEPEIPGPPVAPPCLVNCDPVLPPPPPEPEDPDNPSNNCFADAFSLNPVDWVFVPVKCALMWAFVPPDGTWDAAMGRVKDPLVGAVGPWNDAISDGWQQVNIGASAGCNGPGIAMPDFMQDGGMPATFYPVKSCSGMASTIAGYTRMLSTAGLVVLAVAKTVQIVQAGLGLSTGVPLYSTGQKA